MAQAMLLDVTKIQALSESMQADGKAIRQILEDAWNVVKSLESGWESDSFEALRAIYNQQQQQIDNQQKSIDAFAMIIDSEALKMQSFDTQSAPSGFQV